MKCWVLIFRCSDTDNLSGNAIANTPTIKEELFLNDAEDAVMKNFHSTTSIQNDFQG